jgi:hypothetical protein
MGFRRGAFRIGSPVIETDFTGAHDLDCYTLLNEKHQRATGTFNELKAVLYSNHPTPYPYKK